MTGFVVFLFWGVYLLQSRTRWHLREVYSLKRFRRRRRFFGRQGGEALVQRADARRWVINYQLGRRNVTIEEATYLSGAEYVAEKAVVTNPAGANQFRPEVVRHDVTQPRDATIDRLGRRWGRHSPKACWKWRWVIVGGECPPFVTASFTHMRATVWQRFSKPAPDAPGLVAARSAASAAMSTQALYHHVWPRHFRPQAERQLLVTLSGSVRGEGDSRSARPLVLFRRSDTPRRADTASPAAHLPQTWLPVTTTSLCVDTHEGKLRKQEHNQSRHFLLKS